MRSITAIAERGDGNGKESSLLQQRPQVVPDDENGICEARKPLVSRFAEQEMISRKQAGYVLDKHGLPFERSHRLEKRDKYRHNEPYDTFSSISPDGQQKSEWYVDWNTGHENYIRAARRSYAAKLGWQRRKRKNAR